MASKREERIQTIATGLLISRMSPVDAITQASLFVGLCEARNAVVAEKAEATPEPEEEDPELALYVSAVRELDSCVELWFIENDYKHGLTPEKTVERWDQYKGYWRRNE